ncbi:NACHT domain-containing protein [Deinococcus sp. SM5_A1]|uniref:NACHT domain-containing protein n=1 Tax=Deinococcus sp. SM5_A1 TaxID=3379094 RepID=UPI00385E062E
MPALEILAIAKTIATTTISTKKLYDDIIKPIFNNTKIKRSRSDALSERLNSYISSNIKKYRSLRTIAHPEKKLDLMQIYIPLTLRDDGEEKSYRLDNFNLKFISDSKPKLIIDYAGMGKSTIFKYLYLSCVKEQFGIPFLLELRKIKKGQSIEEYIRIDISNKRVNYDIEELNELFLTGRCVLLLDGLDEVDKELLPDIISNILKLTEDEPSNKILVSSRDIEILRDLDNFEKFDIAPLNKEESINLLRNYGLGEAEYMDDLLKEVKHRYEEISHLLKNPLMVSLLFKSYQFKTTIPLKKSSFYKQVYDALYESHDFSKEANFSRYRASKLNYDDFYKACSILGYLTYKDKIIDYDKESIIKYIKDIKKYAPELSFQPSLLLKDLTEAVPFILKEGSNYKWTHKSFQEYFAAQALAVNFKDNSAKALNSILDSADSIYENFLDFYYDIDQSGYMINIIKPLIDFYEILAQELQNDILKCPVDITKLREAYKTRKFAVYQGNRIVADEVVKQLSFSKIAQPMFMLSEKLEIIIVVEIFDQDFFWSIPARRKVRYVTLGKGVESCPTPIKDEAVTVLKKYDIIGYIDSDTVTLPENDSNTLISLLNYSFYIEIDLKEAKLEVDLVEQSIRNTHSLFDF